MAEICALYNIFKERKGTRGLILLKAPMSSILCYQIKSFRMNMGGWVGGWVGKRYRSAKLAAARQSIPNHEWQNEYPDRSTDHKA